MVGKKPLTRHQRLVRQAAKGIVPKRYQILTKRQKKVARLIVSGMPVLDVCKRMKLDSNTYYNWLHCHPLFKKYYYKVAEQRAMFVEQRLDAKLPRAVRIIEDSLESRDPYFAAETAVTLLKGRGKFKSNTAVQQELKGNVQINATVENLGGNSKEMAHAFLEAMAQMASGGQFVRPKIININKLPAAEIETLRGESPSIQEGEQAEVVGADK